MRHNFSYERGAKPSFFPFLRRQMQLVLKVAQRGRASLCRYPQEGTSHSDSFLKASWEWASREQWNENHANESLSACLITAGPAWVSLPTAVMVSSGSRATTSIPGGRATSCRRIEIARLVPRWHCANKKVIAFLLRTRISGATPRSGIGSW